MIWKVDMHPFSPRKKTDFCKLDLNGWYCWATHSQLPRYIKSSGHNTLQMQSNCHSDRGGRDRFCKAPIWRHCSSRSTLQGTSRRGQPKDNCTVGSISLVSSQDVSGGVCRMHLRWATITVRGHGGTGSWGQLCHSCSHPVRPRPPIRSATAGGL